MRDILIRRNHGTSEKAARQAAEKIARKLGKEFDLAYAWNGNVLAFRRSGLGGELVADEQEVRIRIRLGFLLLPIRPRIEAEIHRFFDENFGPQGVRSGAAPTPPSGGTG
jgi:putative polyhydroxyalkanoate system protein